MGGVGGVSKLIDGDVEYVAVGLSFIYCFRLSHNGGYELASDEKIRTKVWRPG